MGRAAEYFSAHSDQPWASPGRRFLVTLSISSSRQYEEAARDGGLLAVILTRCLTILLFYYRWRLGNRGQAVFRFPGRWVAYLI